MFKTNKLVAAAVASAAAVAVAAPSASAAQINDLCKTNRLTYISYSTPGGGIGGIEIPVGALVRILSYGAQNTYGIRYAGEYGSISRDAITQNTCYQQ